MRRRLDVYLWDAHRAAEEIVTLAQGKTLQDYLADKTLRAATERYFITIGEAMMRIRDISPADLNRMTLAPAVISFRNHLTHRYDRIDDEEVWNIVQTTLPVLLAAMATWLKELQMQETEPGPS